MWIDITEYRILPDHKKWELLELFELDLLKKKEELLELNQQVKNSLPGSNIRELTPVFEFINNLKKEIEKKEDILNKIKNHINENKEATGSDPDSIAGSISGNGISQIRPDKRPFKVPKGAKTYEEIVAEENEIQKATEKKRLQELLGLSKK